MTTDDLCGSSASALAAAIRRGERTACEVLEAHLDRIARHDDRLGTLCGTFAERARARAAELDRRRGQLNRERLWTYLRLPRPTSYMRADYLKQHRENPQD